jgi:uncharacterized membrane protein
MRLSPASWIAIGLSLVSAAVAAWTWAALPPGGGLAVNVLGLDGVRHVMITRAPLWIIPAVSTFLTLSLSAARLRAAAEAAAQPLEMTLISLAGLLLVTELALVGRAFDPDFNVMRPVAAAVGVLLIAIGNYLGKARRNAVFGVRTPWTLADPTVWDRTHRFTGLGMVLAGVALIALAFLLKDSNLIGVAIGACAALPPLAGVVRSAGLYRRLQRG